MRILAIDCTAKSVSAAIAEDGKLMGEGFLNIPLTHSETLLPLCEQLISNTRSPLSSIDAFAVTAGPGSFTGVRIGISAVKGMAFAKNQPVFHFSALEAMALGFENIPGLNGILCALMDARCNQFYNALFAVENGKITRITDDRIVILDDLENQLKKEYNNKNIVFCGDGAKLFLEKSNGIVSGSLAPEHLMYQKAASIAISASKGQIESALSPEELRPIYLRKSQAEREKIKNTQNNICKEKLI